MGLASKLAAGAPRTFNSQQQCKTSGILSRLPDGESVALQQMLNDPEWTSSAIARALTDEGYRISPSSVRRHRRGECECT